MVEYIVAGALTVGIVAFDEEVKHLCKHYLKHKEAEINAETE